MGSESRCWGAIRSVTSWAESCELATSRQSRNQPAAPALSRSSLLALLRFKRQADAAQQVLKARVGDGLAEGETVCRQEGTSAFPETSADEVRYLINITSF